MARHLSKQHELIVWNRTREKAERHAREHGTTVADDLAECAAAEIIITMLPTSREVDQIVDKLLAISARHALDRRDERRPERQPPDGGAAGDEGVPFVDAPVTGATVGRRRHTDHHGRRRAGRLRAREPILRICGKKIIHVGRSRRSRHQVLTNSIMGRRCGSLRVPAAAKRFAST